MSNEIISGFFLACTGGAIGYVVKAIEERPQPGIVIESVELLAESGSKFTDVEITPEIKDLETRSAWIEPLPEKMPIKKFRALLDEFKRRVAELEALSLSLPRLGRFVRLHQGETDYQKEYQEFLRADEITNESLQLFASNIAGLMNRNELKLSQLQDSYQSSGEGLSSTDVVPQMGSSSQPQVKREKRTEELTLKLLSEWYPKDLLEAIDLVSEQLGEQIPINKDLLKALESYNAGIIELGASKLLFVNALLVNNGRTPITFDKYGTLAISGIKQRHYLCAESAKEKILINAHEAVQISLRSDPIELDDYEYLKALQDSKVLHCCLTMRIIRSSRRSSRRWVTSPDSDFSFDAEATKKDFMKNAHLPRPVRI